LAGYLRLSSSPQNAALAPFLSQKIRRDRQLIMLLFLNLARFSNLIPSSRWLMNPIGIHISLGRNKRALVKGPFVYHDKIECDDEKFLASRAWYNSAQS
jgi:hypothetical protein